MNHEQSKPSEIDEQSDKQFDEIKNEPEEEKIIVKPLDVVDMRTSVAEFEKLEQECKNTQHDFSLPPTEELPPDPDQYLDQNAAENADVVEAIVKKSRDKPETTQLVKEFFSVPEPDHESDPISDSKPNQPEPSTVKSKLKVIHIKSRNNV